MCPANEAEITELPEIGQTNVRGVVARVRGLCQCGQSEVSARAQNREQIEYKSSKGRPPHSLNKAFNKKLRVNRFKVEQAYGTMKRRFNLALARYSGAVKVQARRHKPVLGTKLLRHIAC